MEAAVEEELAVGRHQWFLVWKQRGLEVLLDFDVMAGRKAKRWAGYYVRHRIHSRGGKWWRLKRAGIFRNRRKLELVCHCVLERVT